MKNVPVGGYQMVEDLGVVNLEANTATIEAHPDIVRAINQTEKPVLFAGLKIIDEGVGYEYRGWSLQGITAGVTYQRLGDVSIYAPDENHLTITHEQ